jgi:uncharacterized protein with von Willebrand factor type A (vWA) domain
VGKALQALCDANPPVLNSATTLLILSDTKTVDLMKATAALQDAKRLAGRVLWLNPIPESKWQYLRSARTLSGLCTMMACNNLQALGQACRRLTRLTE